MDTQFSDTRAGIDGARDRSIQLLPGVGAGLLPESEPVKPALIVQGMHGMGDNLHQRSIIRELSKAYSVWLETSWPCIYWDMPDVHFMRRGAQGLRTQLKNQAREADSFTLRHPPHDTPTLKIHYPPREVKARGSVLRAMSYSAGVPEGDFRFPVHPDWIAKADRIIEDLKPDRPLMFFRPLVMRREWTGGATRNPDAAQYAELYEMLRERFYVVSVADLVADVEWTEGPALRADVCFHRGELDVETLFGLAKRSALLFGAPGFVAVMGQAIGTPTVTVFGGYEDASSFSSGAKLPGTKWLPVEPIRPCPCWTHNHQCRKRLDMTLAKKRINHFLKECGL